MTRLCAAIFVRDMAQALRDVALAAEAGADMVELRIDEFTETGKVRELLSEVKLPTIVTCRASWEGGHCELPDIERVLLLFSSEGASYIDIELET